MATIHHTTLVPGKLDLLSDWLPAQSWYIGTAAGQPELSRAGVFRLDDPDGEVGIEFMIVLDHAAANAVAYLVPMTYRGSPLAGAEDALIGTAEHGVLGTRWIYDGVRDPVLLTQLGELIQGRVQAQAQSQSSMPDPTVHSRPAPGPVAARDARLDISFARALVPADTSLSAELGSAGAGQVSATWTAGDSSSVRGVVATATLAAGPGVPAGPRAA
ncbi:MAG TPA: 1,4-alpha-glucan branching protein [Streptosporangiaceae bacterium]|nr:1,4-alpha-glucan branching protein [Streptosporangiaceae bacterium]